MCPDCNRVITEIKRKWKDGKYDVEGFCCECGTEFESYKEDGKESFTLKKGKTDKQYHKP